MIGKRTSMASAVVAIILIASALPAFPPLDLLKGLSLDALTALRWRLIGNAHESADSPSVVIALDEETYNTPPFKGTPTIAWTREIGRVVAAALEGGAKVIGFDIVLPTSIEESEIEFDSDTVGAKMRGFDRDYLRALAAGAKADKIVLGEVQIGDNLLLPAAGQRVAVGQQRNIRSLNVFSDPDDVVRRAPLTFNGRSGLSPSMALELAARAEGLAPEIGPDRVSLAGYRIPATGPNEMTLNFAGGTNDIPTYSLADLRGCVEKDDKDFFRRNFSGKVVLIGSTFDLSDLKLTSKRFAVGAGPPPVERCTHPASAAARAARDEINGVYIQATAINNILRREALSELAPPLRLLLSLIAASLGALAALVLTPMRMVAAYALLALVWTALATVLFAGGLAVPLFEPLAAALIALAATAGYRLIVADRDKLALRKNFELYLSPAVIRKMLNSNAPPALGGEVREITALFFDLVGYSTISERLAPVELVALINRYLSTMTDIIEERGGFVDKYVGDAIVAIFGAPIEAPDHAADAVRAALSCNAALHELNQSIDLPDGVKLAHRIGLNSGQALVGNIGSRRRFNYTAIGDAVNIAARLESANRHFGTTILASQATVERAGEAFMWREIDTIRVKGRVQPVRVFEPIAIRGQESSEQRSFALGYAEGLARWRARDFAAAAVAFARSADRDPPSASFLARVEKIRLGPPAESWEPIHALD
ncbi:MAG TPA: adenylate/guanylate cyclase domain-containing protein [Roseiarcus sp.]|nr:adenylate/guanylate cyclase domain-containing protein [Roseiarcus sp.]